MASCRGPVIPTTTLNKQRKPRKCRYGATCSIPGCSFKHPAGHTPPAAAPAAAPWPQCRNGANCAVPGCSFQHPPKAAAAPGAPAINNWFTPPPAKALPAQPAPSPFAFAPAFVAPAPAASKCLQNPAAALNVKFRPTQYKDATTEGATVMQTVSAMDEHKDCSVEEFRWLAAMRAKTGAAPTDAATPLAVQLPPAWPPTANPFVPTPTPTFPASSLTVPAGPTVAAKQSPVPIQWATQSKPLFPQPQQQAQPTPFQWPSQSKQEAKPLFPPQPQQQAQPTPFQWPSQSKQEAKPLFPPQPPQAKQVKRQKGAENRTYCGANIGVGAYAEGAHRWCTQRGQTCTCDGRCGPGDGCQCDACYSIDFTSWPCLTCTFVNTNPHAVVCDVCQGPRVAGGPAGGGPQTGAAADAAAATAAAVTAEAALCVDGFCFEDDNSPQARPAANVYSEHRPVQTCSLIRMKLPSTGLQRQQEALPLPKMRWNATHRPMSSQMAGNRRVMPSVRKLNVGRLSIA